MLRSVAGRSGCARPTRRGSSALDHTREERGLGGDSRGAVAPAAGLVVCRATSGHVWVAGLAPDPASSALTARPGRGVAWHVSECDSSSTEEETLGLVLFLLLLRTARGLLLRLSTRRRGRCAARALVSAKFNNIRAAGLTNDCSWSKHEGGPQECKRD